MSDYRSEVAGHGALSFGDAIDMPAFARLLESFFQATGIPNGVVDADGTLLCLAAGDSACTRFHRAFPACAERCRDSNLLMMRNLRTGCVAGGQCHNGLMDYATPVVVEGQMLATLFLGQVLHEAPDLAFFSAQAARYGFDEERYLAAIQAVPVVDKAQIDHLMSAMVEMARMMAASGLTRRRQAMLEQDLSNHIQRQIQLKDILDSSPVAIGWSDGESQIEYVNHRFTQLLGYTLDDLPDLQTWYLLAYPDTHYRQTVVAPWAQAVAAARDTQTEPPKLEANVTCKSGEVRRVVVSTSYVGSRRLVNFTDITERWLSEQRKQAHDRMLEMVARGSDLPHILDALVCQMEAEDGAARCSILLLDDTGRHLLSGAAPHLPEFYNLAIHGIEIGVGVGSCGTAAALGQRVIVEDIATHAYWQPYAELAQTAGLRACWSEPILSSANRVLGTFAIYYGEPRCPNPDDFERMGFASNLAAIAIEHQCVHEELERRAYTDDLTGLANRRRFLEQAEEELARVQRYGTALSLVMLDIDRFKQVNDHHGHKVGDLVLQHLAQVCRTVLRDVDVVGRIGGEEFAVLLPHTGCAAALDAAERLRAALAESRVALGDGRELLFTVSMGVATLCEGCTGIDALLIAADRALYQAKAGGRNRVCGMAVPPAAA